MNINKKIYLLCFILSFVIYIFLLVIIGQNLFITRLFVIFPLLFLGAFLFSSNKKNQQQG
ncbi:hypothetical protein STAHO0001_0445 [Staphylococcus hominis SK119]|nr:hypothetical protein STAHO0001_0445 [Staphylococcus hominis SK119]